MRTLVGSLLLGAVMGCSPSLLDLNQGQGIEGTVLIGPQCPVASPDNPCPDLPYQAWIGIWDGRGFSVTRVQSGVDGLFVVGLRAGFYTLVPESGDPFPVAGEQMVAVVEGAFTEVVVNFDTGIR